jgi:RNA polymerase sigma factor (sigma-70 family)
MASQATETVLRKLRRFVFFGAGGQPDATLLGQFIESRDEDAFAVLMRRHGPMVLGVCQRLLPNRQDAEDAFQATFLVLVRKADAVRPREMVGNWLYGVAHQTAIRVRALNAKRRSREKPMTLMPEPQASVGNAHEDLKRWLDRELSRLPDKYRAALVACDLQGKTRIEAARELGWPEGSLSSRLARGRALLARRLAKQGAVFSAGALAAELAPSAAAAVPAPLMMGTIQAANLIAAGQSTSAAGLSAKVAAVAEGIIQIMNLTKWATTATVILVVTALGVGLGVGGYQLVQGGASAAQGNADNPPAAQGSAPATAKTDKERIVGVWRIKSGEAEGKDIAPDFSSLGRFTFRGDGTMTLSEPDEEKAGVYRFVEPGKIDLGPKNDIAPALYRFDGDNRLTLCFGKVRPTEFTADKGAQRVLWYLVRAKPGEEKPSQEELDKRKAEPVRPAELQPLREAATSQLTINKLRNIALAFHTYHDPNKSYPADAIYSADGKTPLLSWRVAILPFLDQKNLYDQFKLDEPWDSEHNKKLIAKMPKEYAAPFGTSAKNGETYYQVVAGPKTLFDGPKKIAMKDIRDGTSNTILALEAKDSVPWTKPADLTLPADIDTKLPVGDHFTKGFHVVLCDGSSWLISAETSTASLRALITPSGGEIADIKNFRRTDP